jgi:TfoX/Sxy family transcriptional regulator of competence genes
MAWIKVPLEHHPLFRAAVPRDPRITIISMFGGLAALASGRLFGGLFARSIIVRLPPSLYPEALALDGSTPFDPMGKGRPTRDIVLLPEDVMDDPSELRRWLSLAHAHALTLPPKKKKPSAKGKAVVKKPAVAAKKKPAVAAKKKPAVAKRR